MKKAILGVVLFILFAGVYLFWTDFGGELVESIKKLVGYNVPELSEPEVIVSSKSEELSFLSIPKGLDISVVAKGLENPRVILFDQKGRMLVSETKAGRVSSFDFGARIESDFGYMA